MKNQPTRPVRRSAPAPYTVSKPLAATMRERKGKVPFPSTKIQGEAPVSHGRGVSGPQSGYQSDASLRATRSILTKLLWRVFRSFVSAKRRLRAPGKSIHLKQS